MKTFWDLPKPVREKIYRLVLVAEEQPVDFEAYKKICGYTGVFTDSLCKTNKPVRVECPSFLRVSRKVEREASPIFFGENTFALSKPDTLNTWKRFAMPRHSKQIRKVAISSWRESSSGSHDGAFKAFRTLPVLETLTFCIDEEKELEGLLAHHKWQPTYRSIKWDPIIGFGPQVNLQLLRLDGIAGLRSLRGLREVNFLRDLSISSEDPGNVGSMSGGFLETVVKKEIMQPRSSKNAQRQEHSSFRFLDLPPELRNMVYSMLLLIPGPTYPVAGKPLSFTSRCKYKSRTARDMLPAPCSVLDVLRVSKQVHDEAQKLFYQNDLVFSTPIEMQDFMCSLVDGRLDCLRSLTLFCKEFSNVASREEWVNGTGLGGTLITLRHMKGLQKLHLLLSFRKLCIRNLKFLKGFADPVDVSRLKDAKTLFTLRGLTDIMIHDLDLVEAEEECHDRLGQSGRIDHKYSQAQKCIARQRAAIRHFNHGLKLAQTGVVVRELYTDKDWREKETWPALERSDCGFDKGCSCGVSGDRPDEVIEISDDSD